MATPKNDLFIGGVFATLAMLIVFGNSGICELFFFLTLSAFLFLLKKRIC
jgi:hypothetical protein